MGNAEEHVGGLSDCDVSVTLVKKGEGRRPGQEEALIPAMF